MGASGRGTTLAAQAVPKEDSSTRMGSFGKTRGASVYLMIRSPREEIAPERRQRCLAALEVRIDHEKPTFRHNGIDYRLTDVHGHVSHESLA